MTLQEQLTHELTQLGPKPASVVVDEPPRQVCCDITESNSLAVSLLALRLRTAELDQAPIARLEQISKSLASRLTYLLEPISPIEIDSQACVVQMRSNPPQQDDDGPSYYELLVRTGGEITLRRFKKENGTGRRPIAATLTREVLLRLVGDFCAVLA